MSTKHQIRRIVAAVLDTAWMIDPEKLEAMVDFLSDREQGVILTEQEIQGRIGVVDAREQEKYQIVGTVAVVPLHGVMAPRMNMMTRISGGTSTMEFQSTIAGLLRRTDLTAIVLDIDSPGGAVSAVEELSTFLRENRNSAIPIVASINGMGASAAYYGPSGASKIYAGPSSQVGSIGVMIVHRDSVKAAENAGVKYTVLRSSEFKAAGNEYESLTAKDQSTLMERITAYHAQMVTAIAANRGVSVAEVETKFGSGKVLLADAALSAGMIDGVKTLDQVVAMFQGGTSASSPQTVTGEDIMDKRIRAALFARGYLASADCDDAVAQAALAGFFHGNVPKTTEEILAVLVPNAQPPADGDDGDGDGQASDTNEPTIDPETRQQLAAQERARIDEINARARLLGGVPENVIAAQVDAGVTVDEASVAFCRWLDAQPQGDNIVPGQASIDKFSAVAVNAMLGRLGQLEDGQELTAEEQSLSGSTLLEIAEEEMAVHNIRFRNRTNAEAKAAAWLQLGAAQGPIEQAAASNDPAYHGAGSFPNLLSSLANKMLDRGMQYASATYPMWTGRLPDVSDFKPHVIAAAGEFNLLPLHADGREFEHSTFAEGMSWIQVDSYGDEFVLTPKMIANDDLDSFTQAMINKGSAHELTLNQLAINLLISDPTVVNGKTMFDASHGNVINPGDKPTDDQFSAMRKSLRRMTGLSGVQKVRYDARYVLTGPEYETDAEKMLRNTIFPQQTDNVNIWNGRYVPITEPMLDEVANPKAWYTFVDPRQLRCIVHCFLSGYSRGGRRRNYFRNETLCRHFQIEGRFAVAAVNHQGVVRNDGNP